MAISRGTSRDIPEGVARRRRSYVVLLCSMLIIVLGGAATLLWQVQQSEATRAANGNVVGPPSLPGSYIDSVFASAGSPMVGTGALIEQQSRLTNIDDAFALGVFFAETSYGAAGVGINCLNPGSVSGGRCGNSSFKYYASYSDAIVDWFNLIRNNYVGRGLTTVYAISNPYVGTSGASTWAAKVVGKMQQYQSETAPPPPPVTPTPTRESRHFDANATGWVPDQGTSQDSKHIVSGRETNKAEKPQTASLPVALRNSIIVGGLVLALVIACLGVALRRRKLVVVPQEISEPPAIFSAVPERSAPIEPVNLPEPIMASMPYHFASLSPSTKELERNANQFVASQGQSVPVAPLFGLSSASSASKNIIREPNTDAFEPVAMPTRGGGLLSRYRNTEMLNKQGVGARQAESDPDLVSLGGVQQRGF